MVSTSVESLKGASSGLSLARSSATLGLLAVVAIFLVSYWPSIAWVAGEWSGSSGVMSHGYLIVALSGFLFIRSLQPFRAAPAASAWWLIPVVLGLSIVWLLAYVANVVAIQTVVLPMILLLTIAAAFGVSAGKTVAFAILYLYFGLPALDHLQFVFQTITTKVVHLLIRVADLPAYVEGNFVLLPSGTFEIAGGCAGLAFVIAGVSLAVLYGHLYHSTGAKKIMLIAITLAVAMLGNWIRVFTIISIGHFSNMQSPLIDDHLTLGWILFAILMVPVFFVARRLEVGEPELPGSGATERDESGPSSNTPWLGLLVAVAALSAGPIWAALAVPAQIESDRVTLSLPENIDGWVGPLPTAWDWQPRYAGVTAERVAEYKSSGTTILAYINIYLRQQQGSELIFFSNDITGSWRSRRSMNDDAPGTVSSARGFRQVAAANAYGSWLIWYRYEIGGRPVTSDIEAKLMQAFSTLRGKPEAGVVAYAISCGQSCDNAETSLADFVAAIGTHVTIEYEVGEYQAP